MGKDRRKTGKTILNLLIAVGFLAVVVFLLFLAAGSVETTMPNNSYAIKITGLSDLVVNGTATVMVPVPAISEEMLTGRHQAFGWQTAVRETPYGRMLAFTTTGSYAPDISVSSGEFEKREEPRLLVPVLATPDMNIEEFSRLPGGTYTSVVFLDGFVPPSEDAAPVRFTLEYRGGGGMKHLVKEDTWTATVDTTVPGAASGFVPVPAEYQVVAGGIRF
ncbi:hypothetical protein F8E02_02950 [Methanoculleus sp. Wushi-C6]|uniref:DUF4382 domain-containing protein n=2 Tax=Methanoculleus caldifontis TaxID=2651577 RepID=A0ABU3X0L4_9EURY|nr:hypothetical protein [Methanoculleus sp. Wushi-C6]